MEILILGANGMLGQALMKEAERRNISAIGLSRRGSEIVCDITDNVRLAAVINIIRPQVIINTAALIDLVECEKRPSVAYIINARAVGVLAEQARKYQIYFVQISTDHYYSNDGYIRHKEGDPVRLLNEYARTKYAGENFALTWHDTLVVRTNIVGFRGLSRKPTFVEWAIDAILNNSSMTLFDDFYTSSIDVTSFSSALFDLLPFRTIGVLNLASSEVASKKVFIEDLAQKIGCTLDGAKTASVKELAGVQRAESLGLDVSCAEVRLGYLLPRLTEVTTQLAKEYLEQANE